MPLEFALRPRFNLERPPPRRRFRWPRLAPLALPIVAYWLAIAGVTHALLRMTAADSAPAEADPPAVVAHTAEVAVAPFAVSPLPYRDVELAASPKDAPLSERASEPAERAPASLAPPGHQVPRAPPSPLEDETSAAKPPAPPRPTAEPAQRRSETVGPKPAIRSTAGTPAIPPLPVSKEPIRDEPPATALPSCESAAAAASETIDLSAARGAPDLTRNAFAAVLENGAYLAHCAIPERAALEICAAVQGGRVVGVSVVTEPRNPAISACVRRAVAALHFPQSSRLDVTRTRFEPSLGGK
jgi:hypothetical protein